MEYHGKLYGKVGRRQIPLTLTSEDVDRLEKERDAFKAELENIANASMRKWEMNNDDFLSEFQAWAQNRARHALSKANDQIQTRHD